MPAKPPHREKPGPVFAIGDTVQLKIGGAEMTAGQFDPQKGRQCLWWSAKGDLKEKFIHEGALRKAGPLPLEHDYSLLSPAEQAQLLALLEKATPKGADAGS
jgi:uncharacterized protein YodC (DUF2158 family)